MEDKSGFELKTITSPEDAAALDKVYELYKKCFPLKEEQVARETFDYVLERNAGGDDFAEHKAKVGTDAKYFVSYIEDKSTGEIIGGAAYDVFKGCCDTRYGGTVHLSFIFVDEDHRGKEHEKLLAEDIKKNCREFCGEKPVLCFAESNAVGRMTVEQYQKDKNTGADPTTRRHLAELKGFKTLDFPYTQPPLEEGQRACDYLDFLVFDDSKSMKNIKSSVVRQHLQRFFDDLFPIEGTSLEMEGLEKTNQFLHGDTDIKFIDVGRKYSKMKRDIERLAESEAEEQKGKTIGEISSGKLRESLAEVDTHRKREQAIDASRTREL